MTPSQLGPHINTVGAGPSDAPPVLLLHGLGGDHRMWSPQWEDLGDRYRLLAWDARGHGQSDWAGPLTADVWVADIDRVLDRWGVDAVSLVGLSMGAVQSILYASSRPQRVRSVALASGWVRLTPDDLERKLDNLPRKATALGMARFAQQYVEGLFDNPASAAASDYRSALAMMPLESYVASAELCFGIDLTDACRAVRAPALVLWGDRDVRMPRLLSEEIAGLISTAQLVDVPRAGHMCNIENPPAFTELLDGFLSARP